MNNIIFKTHKEDSRGNVFTTFFAYRVNFGGKSFLIPRGFDSDGASVPRLFWRVVFPNSDSHATTAGICHDWIYRVQPADWTRKEADKMFLALLIEHGASVFSALAAYYAVRMFGWIAWNENRQILEFWRGTDKCFDPGKPICKHSGKKVSVSEGSAKK